ncbi:hypothetical protein BRADI_3g50273v3 [Brachypodium distachyon]|uniref:Uncharacterized protein n=1 Tax=Brachypodium distachyon TaxID=15368 RepID=A0A0Q3FN05_BRADI|nr:hypothetical protein BRADI_3g50273v3 [Brachypodium distachyon]
MDRIVKGDGLASHPLKNKEQNYASYLKYRVAPWGDTGGDRDYLPQRRHKPPSSSSPRPEDAGGQSPNGGQRRRGSPFRRGLLLGGSVVSPGRRRGRLLREGAAVCPCGSGVPRPDLQGTAGLCPAGGVGLRGQALRGMLGSGEALGYCGAARCGLLWHRRARRGLPWCSVCRRGGWGGQCGGRGGGSLGVKRASDPLIGSGKASGLGSLHVSSRPWWVDGGCG